MNSDIQLEGQKVTIVAPGILEIKGPNGQTINVRADPGTRRLLVECSGDVALRAKTGGAALQAATGGSAITVLGSETRLDGPIRPGKANGEAVLNGITGVVIKGPGGQEARLAGADGGNKTTLKAPAGVSLVVPPGQCSLEVRSDAVQVSGPLPGATTFAVKGNEITLQGPVRPGGGTGGVPGRHKAALSGVFGIVLKGPGGQEIEVSGPEGGFKPSMRGPAGASVVVPGKTSMEVKPDSVSLVGPAPASSSLSVLGNEVRINGPIRPGKPNDKATLNGPTGLVMKGPGGQQIELAGPEGGSDTTIEAPAGVRVVRPGGASLLVDATSVHMTGPLPGATQMHVKSNEVRLTGPIREGKPFDKATLLGLTGLVIAGPGGQAIELAAPEGGNTTTVRAPAGVKVEVPGRASLDIDGDSISLFGPPPGGTQLHVMSNEIRLAGPARPNKPVDKATIQALSGVVIRGPGGQSIDMTNAEESNRTIVSSPSSVDISGGGSALRLGGEGFALRGPTGEVEFLAGQDTSLRSSAPIRIACQAPQPGARVEMAVGGSELTVAKDSLTLQASDPEQKFFVSAPSGLDIQSQESIQFMVPGGSFVQVDREKITLLGPNGKATISAPQGLQIEGPQGIILDLATVATRLNQIEQRLRRLEQQGAPTM